MLVKPLILLLMCAVFRTDAQLKTGDTCVTDDGISGVCKYIHTCKYAQEALSNNTYPTLCSWEGETAVACCPSDRESGILGRVFIDMPYLSNENMRCYYDGYFPMSCCPIVKEQDLFEPQQCPPLPSIPTPVFNNPAHRIAWEKCVANEKHIRVCSLVGSRYERINTCAVPESEQRISNAKDAEPRQFPHMAVLGCNNRISTDNDDDIAWVGGGSLISDKYILTAGHVLISATHGQLRYALLGTINKTDIRSGVLHSINALIPHPQYVSSSKHYDIALVELNRRVVFSEYIRPICLPVPGILAQDEMRYIAGWGLTKHKAETSTILQTTTVPVVDGSRCNSTLVWTDFVWNDTTMICAGGSQNERGWQDSCEGDSGGPLMYIVPDKRFRCNYVVDGVVSWGGVCAMGQPASYTRVSAYFDWIVKTVWSNEYTEATGGF